MNNFIHLIDRIDHILIERKLLLSKQKILIAVSGGQDSIFLLNLLFQLRFHWEWEIGIVNCDHMWNHLSKAASLYVSQLACQMNLNYYQCISPSFYRKEETARRWRYKLFQRIACLHDYKIIITAHTASDRVETLFYNLFKGSGLHGLHSLTWKRKIHKNTIHLVRPLLSTTRGELSQIFQQIKIPLCLDSTNLNLRIYRNRIRYQLLPYLRLFFNPNLDRSIAQFAEILHSESLFLEILTKILRNKIEITEKNQRILDVQFIRVIPFAIQRRIIKQFLENQSIYSFHFFHIEKVRIISNILIYKSDIYLPGGNRLKISQKYILLCSQISF
uniref:tRNA(Ile)-lysidine synthase, chloroplastic n=1 Tax=Nitellopsis obtusa TaxID=40811 RepID=A0A8F6YG94_9VIRI|nr:hypothetical protein RF62 [Nitellopsis obtusa]